MKKKKSDCTYYGRQKKQLIKLQSDRNFFIPSIPLLKGFLFSTAFFSTIARDVNNIKKESKVTCIDVRRYHHWRPNCALRELT